MPDWFKLDHYSNEFDINQTFYEFTTVHEFNITTIYENKEYNKPITLEIKM